MQIGEKVRFLNEVGGGVISGFQGKDIVLVEDEDGFDIPMLRSQVVVVETNANNFVRKPKNPQPAPSSVQAQPAAAPAVERRSLKATVNADLDAEEDETDPSERPMTFQPKPKERKGGELLNVCLAFVPEDSRELSNMRFEAYLINDSNYYVSAVVANNEGAAWHLRWQGTLLPNTKEFIEDFDRSILNDLQRLSVQLIAWKQDKPYMLKPAVGVELRLDTVKFYKLHVFQPSPFFREPALIYDIVRDDRPLRQVFVEAEEVLDALRGGVESPEAIEEPETVDDSTSEEVSEAPVRSRAEEREALKAAKRALKAEQQAAGKDGQPANKKGDAKPERDPHFSKPNHRPADDEIIEVDLHINALLDNTAGLSPSVLLNTQLTEFRIIMDRNIRKKGQRIVFIHGKGEGVLRQALIKELRHRYRTCTYEDANFQKYGYGATMVRIG